MVVSIATVGIIIGIIIIACLSNLNEERNRRNYVDWQQRRTQEQIYQEQVKNQAFQQYTASRLDQHDQQLGLNTRPANQNLTYGTGGEQNYLPDQQGQAVAGHRRLRVAVPVLSAGCMFALGVLASLGRYVP